VTTTKPMTAEESRRYVDDARAERRQVRDQLDTESAELASLTERLGSGDSSVDLGELARLRLIVADLDTLATACDRKVNLAARDAVTDNPDIAEALAPIIQEALGGVPVIVTTERPTRLRAGLPAVVLVQRRFSQRDNRTGELSGRVVVHYMRSAHHTPLTPERWREALPERTQAQPDHDGEPLTYELGNGFVDRIPLRVTGALPWLPVIAGEPSAGDWSTFVQGCVRAAVSKIDGRDRQGQRRWRARIDVSRKDVQVISDDTDNEGVRTRTIEAVLHATKGSDLLERSDTVRLVREAAEASVGTSFPLVGRLAAVEVSALAPMARGPMPMTVRLSGISQRPTR